MANKKQLEHGFMIMYEKDGYYWGSYDLFPSKDDVKLIKVAVWRGYEAPAIEAGLAGHELLPEVQQQITEEELY